MTKAMTTFKAVTSCLPAIKTIIVADLVMSVDNVIAIAGAAQSSGEHQMLLVVLGLLISIPIIVWGSQLVIKLMERFPIIIVAGGMLLGWIAGGMLVTDPVFANTEKVGLDDQAASDRRRQIRRKHYRRFAGSGSGQARGQPPRKASTRHRSLIPQRFMMCVRQFLRELRTHIPARSLQSP